MRTIAIIFIIVSTIGCVTSNNGYVFNTRKQHLARAFIRQMYYPIVIDALEKTDTDDAHAKANALLDKVSEIFMSDFTEEELEEIVLLYNSPYMLELLDRINRGESLTEDDLQKIKLCEKYSSGYRKLQSNEIMTKLAKAMIDFRREY